MQFQLVWPNFKGKIDQKDHGTIFPWVNYACQKFEKRQKLINL